MTLSASRACVESGLSGGGGLGWGTSLRFERAGVGFVVPSPAPNSGTPPPPSTGDTSDVVGGEVNDVRFVCYEHDESYISSFARPSIAWPSIGWRIVERAPAARG